MKRAFPSLLFVALCVLSAARLGAAVRVRTRIAWESSENEVDSGAIFLNRTVGRACSSSETYMRYGGDNTDPAGREDVFTSVSAAREAGAWSGSVDILVRADWYSDRPPPASENARVFVRVALLDDKNKTKVIGSEIVKQVFPGAFQDCPRSTVAVVTVSYDAAARTYSLAVAPRAPVPFVILSLRFSWNGPPGSELDGAVSFLGKTKSAKCLSSSSSSSPDYISYRSDDDRASGSELADVSLTDALRDDRWNGSVDVALRAAWRGRYGPPGGARALVFAALVNAENRLISRNVSAAVFPAPVGVCPGRRVATVRVVRSAKGAMSLRMLPVPRPPAAPVVTLRVWVTWRSNAMQADSAVAFAGDSVSSCGSRTYGRFVTHLGDTSRFQGKLDTVVALSASRQAGKWSRRTTVQVRAAWRSTDARNQPLNIFAAAYVNDQAISGRVVRKRIPAPYASSCSNLANLTTITVDYVPSTRLYKVSM